MKGPETISEALMTRRY